MTRMLMYILCDRDVLTDKLKKEIRFPQNTKFIQSDRSSKDMLDISHGVLDDSWMKCGKAHLTTILHSKEMGYSGFWNIDADDTYFCLSSKRTYELLSQAVVSAQEKNQDITSLDMHYSESDGNQWTFGVTYIRNQIDWVAKMKEHLDDERRASHKRQLLVNLDAYFTFIRDIDSSVNIATFYANNLRFIHDNDDVWTNIENSGLSFWKDNILHWPIKEFLLQDYEGRSKKVVPEDADAIEIGITEEESLSELRRMSNRRTIDLKGKEVILWGTGDWYGRYVGQVLEHLSVVRVIDNNSSKWGQKTAEGLEIISSDYLQGKENKVAVLAMLGCPKHLNEVYGQLERMKINNFAAVEDWLSV